jgi:hypothetical protein
MEPMLRQNFQKVSSVELSSMSLIMLEKFSLNRFNTHQAAVILCTDGESSDGNIAMVIYFYDMFIHIFSCFVNTLFPQAMKPFEQLPVQVPLKLAISLSLSLTLSLSHSRTTLSPSFFLNFFLSIFYFLSFLFLCFFLFSFSHTDAHTHQK